MSQESNEQVVDPNTFPFKLGPFGICTSQVSLHHFSTLICSPPDRNIHENGTYQIDPRQIKRDQNHDFTHLMDFFDYIDKSTSINIYSYGVSGNISPLHIVTLNAESKKHAQIPADAKYFAWCYPSVLPSNEICLTQEQMPTWAADPNIMFFTVGGYMYFDTKCQLLRINTLIPSADGGLQFSKPMKWDNRFTSCLHKAGRFQDITLAALSKTGAKYFCWLFPQEELTNEQRSTRRFTTHGGFVYLFHEPGDLTNKDLVAKDRYFEVLGGELKQQEVIKESIADNDQFETYAIGDLVQINSDPEDEEKECHLHCGNITKQTQQQITIKKETEVNTFFVDQISIALLQKNKKMRTCNEYMKQIMNLKQEKSELINTIKALQHTVVGYTPQKRYVHDDNHQLRFWNDELSKMLQKNLENYMFDQRENAKVLDELQLFHHTKGQTIRNWNYTLKKKHFADFFDILEEKLEEKYEDIDTEKIAHNILFDAVVSCFDVLHTEHNKIYNKEYDNANVIDMVLMNILIFYQLSNEPKMTFLKKRIANIISFINDKIGIIYQRINAKYEQYIHGNEDRDKMYEFIAKCCQHMWNVLHYNYTIYPNTFEVNEGERKYDGKLHEREGVYQGDVVQYCAFPAIMKDKQCETKIWVVCNESLVCN
eukprot:182101_1